MERLWVFALASVFASMAMAGVLVVSGMVGARGIDVAHAACRESGADQYTMTATVRNTQETFKAASVNMQTRFSPRPGQSWPDRATRVKHEQETQFATVVLDPGGEATAEASVAFPGASRMNCTVRAKLGSQERFARRPTEAEAKDILQGRRSMGGGGRARGTRRSWF